MYIDYKKVKIGDKVRFDNNDELFGTVIAVTVYQQFSISHVLVKWYNHKGMFVTEYRHAVGETSKELKVYEEGGR